MPHEKLSRTQGQKTLCFMAFKLPRKLEPSAEVKGKDLRFCVQFERSRSRYHPALSPMPWAATAGNLSESTDKSQEVSQVDADVTRKGRVRAELGPIKGQLGLNQGFLGSIRGRLCVS